MDRSQRAVVGVDGGNTKTVAVLVTLDGRLAAHARTGTSNWQTLGEERAGRALQRVTAPLAAAAREQGLRIDAFAFGLTGCDRPRDQAVLEGLAAGVAREAAAVADVAPDAPRTVLNDACLVLRAGTPDDVGVAVSSGTGGNCVARAPDGRRLQVGGITMELGDGGGAGDIALQGLRAMGLARDGRGWETRLTDLVLTATGLGHVVDLLDFAIPGALPPEDDPDAHPPRLADLAPLVFEAAREGDIVCRRILEDTGRALGRQAVAAAHRFWTRDDAFPLVLGGTVLQRASVDNFARAIVLETRATFPGAHPVTLDHEPILGAPLLALDALAPADPALAASLRDGTLAEGLGAALDALFQP